MPNPKPKRRKKLLLFSCLGLLVAALGSVAVLKNKEAPIPIQKEKVIRRNLVETVTANGKIQPVIQVKISPEVSGEIIELPLKEGMPVKKGELLVKIKPDNYIASRNSCKAAYERSLTSSNSAWASLEKADLDYKRNVELHKAKLVSDSVFQEAKTGYDIALAGVAGAKGEVAMAYAALQKAEDDLSKTTIYSPIGGTLTKLNSQLGERVVGTAMMAGTEIMTVSDLNAMDARVDIGEIDVVLMQPGLNAHLEVDAFKDRKFNGVVTEIANSAKNLLSANSQEATKFEVKIRISEREAFRPGMSVTAEIETRCRSNVLTAPIQSVTTRLPKGTNNANTGTNALAAAPSNSAPAPARTGDVSAGDKNKKQSDKQKLIEGVFVVENGRVRLVPVKLGISDDAYMEITEGLKEGDEVVSGNYRAINRELEDGKLVVVGTPKAQAKEDN